VRFLPRLACFRLIPLLYVHFNNSFICNVIRAIFFRPEKVTNLHSLGVGSFSSAFGGFRGSLGKMIGFLRSDRNSVSAQNFHRQVLVASGAASLALFLALVFYLRQVSTAGSSKAICISKLGVRSSVSFTRRLPWSASVAPRSHRLDPCLRICPLRNHRNGGLLWAKRFAALRRPGAVPDSDGLDGKPHLLAVLLIAAIAVERYMPTARQPSKETAAALLVVALAAYLTSAAFLAAPAAPVAHAANLLSRPWDLLPAALFLIAAVCFSSG